nr:hypothetical protein [Tanacetum cinerariifolium]
MTTLAENMIVAGVENRPLMLDKAMYDSWQSRMRLYIKGKKNGRMMLDLIDHGPLVYPTIEEDVKIRKKYYSELTQEEQLKDDYDIQATNIILMGLPPDVYYVVNHYEKLKISGIDVMRKRYADPLALVSTLIICTILLSDDPIACLNKEMSFMSTVFALHFPLTNNQLKTSSNPQNQSTIQDGRVIVQQVQGRHGSNAAGMGLKGNASGSGGNTSGQVKFVKCYNCQDLGVADNQATQTIITHNAAFHSDDLDAYDSDCDDISLAKVVLMANLSSYGLDTLKDIFNVFDKDLLNEITKVQAVLNQMEAVVEQCSIDTKCFEIKKKYFFLDNDRLLEHIIYQDIVHTVVNSCAVICDSKKNDADFVKIYNKCLELKAELVKEQYD